MPSSVVTGEIESELFRAPTMTGESAPKDRTIKYTAVANPLKTGGTRSCTIDAVVPHQNSAKKYEGNKKIRDPTELGMRRNVVINGVAKKHDMATRDGLPAIVYLEK